MREEIILTFVDEHTSARAILLTQQASRTCAAVLDCLPMTARAHHGIYSGSEVAMVLPEVRRVPAENATCQVLTGDVGFVALDKDSYYGVAEEFSEICWFYDRDARPSMWEGPIAVNIFARLIDAEAFHGVCRRMRTEGEKTVELRRG